MKEKLKSLMPQPVKTGIYKARLSYQRVKRFAFEASHPGSQFGCNYCGTKMGAFMPDGEPHQILVDLQVLSAGVREHCRCPHCYSKDRDRLIRFFIERKTHLLSEPNTVLHFAPEPVVRKWFNSLNNLVYINADLDPMLADEVMDITAIPLQKESVDVVICNHVLEHIPNDGLAMRELFRVMKPGGWAILQVPISPILDKTIEDLSDLSHAERERRFGQRDHVRIYGKDYVERLMSIGFEVKQIEPSSFLSDTEIEHHGILAQETIYFCTKS